MLHSAMPAGTGPAFTGGADFGGADFAGLGAALVRMEAGAVGFCNVSKSTLHQCFYPKHSVNYDFYVRPFVKAVTKTAMKFAWLSIKHDDSIFLRNRNYD
jgi:hypothetical protein